MRFCPKAKAVDIPGSEVVTLVEAVGCVRRPVRDSVNVTVAMAITVIALPPLALRPTLKLVGL
jgi:hypothetical protein